MSKLSSLSLFLQLLTASVSSIFRFVRHTYDAALDPNALAMTIQSVTSRSRSRKTREKFSKYPLTREHSIAFTARDQVLLIPSSRSIQELSLSLLNNKSTNSRTTRASDVSFSLLFSFLLLHPTSTLTSLSSSRPRHTATHPGKAHPRHSFTFLSYLSLSLFLSRHDNHHLLPRCVPPPPPSFSSLHPFSLSFNRRTRTPVTVDSLVRSSTVMVLSLLVRFPFSCFSFSHFFFFFFSFSRL